MTTLAFIMTPAPPPLCKRSLAMSYRADIPFLESISSFGQAAERLAEDWLCLPQAIDHFLLSGNLGMIGRSAYEISGEFEGDRAPMLVTAICLAVVECVEGKRRPLRRKRRRYPKNGGGEIRT